MLAVVFVALLALIPVELPLEAWRADPAMDVQDAYKWIFQATQGGEHGAPTREQAATWLEREWNEVGAPAAGELLSEPLGTSGIVRINIRPYREAGGTQDALLAAFVASAASFRADPAAFRQSWAALGDLLRQAPVGRLTRADWERLDEECRARNYPAMHHSDTYVRLRQPAYRVVTAAEARKLLAGLRGTKTAGRLADVGARVPDGATTDGPAPRSRRCASSADAVPDR
jgi:hypothetical protein